jgi:DNA-binding NarL/FixJ family response regulator
MSIPLVTGVLLADDHPIVLHGLRDLLNAEPDFRVVDEVGDGAEAVKRALEDDIDLAILDVTMPRMTGLQAARELSSRRPELRTLMSLLCQEIEWMSWAGVGGWSSRQTRRAR